MFLYSLAAAVALVSGAAGWFAFRRQSQRVALGTGTVVALVMFGFVISFQPRNRGSLDEQNVPQMSFTYFDDHRPAEIPSDEYMGSKSCVACHQHQHQTWHASYHRTMTQLATPTAIVAEIDDVTVEVSGRTYRFFHREDVLWAEFVLADPQDVPSRVQRPLVMLTGSHHMQVFWYPTSKSRVLGQFPLIYLIQDRKWVPRRDAFLVAPHVPAPSETGRWNDTCTNCHTTHPRSRPDQLGGWDTQTAEFGISCEACHGPGQGHVQRHRRGAESTLTDRIVNPAKLSHERSSEICGRCHSLTAARSEEEHKKTLQAGFAFRPGDDLAATRTIVKNDATTRRRLSFFSSSDVEDIISNAFWPDGMARVSGREFSGMSESACYTRGTLACTNCHDMHKRDDDPRSLAVWANDQLGPGMHENGACLECHDATRFGEQHTHHAPASSGSNCFNCHMPYTSFGILKTHRSHQISIPDVAKDRAAGRPNACNLCHLDQTLAWSATHLQDWFGTPTPELTDQEQSVAASLLWLLTGDAGQRAIAACAMGRPEALQASGDDWQAPFLARMLEDPYAGVRYVSSRSLRRLPGFSELEYDYVGPAIQRAAAREAVMQQWSLGASTGARLLLTADSEVDQPMLNQLLRQRNDRDLFLAE